MRIIPVKCQRSSRAILLCVAFFLSSINSLSAGEGILVPREVYVGDTAEFSFESGLFASVLEAGTLFSVPADELPSSPDLDVKSILVAQHGATASVTIRFIPWVSGVIKLPSFKIKSVPVTPPVVRIGSLVEKMGKTSIEPARSPLLVPGTTWILYGAIAAILFAIVVAIVLAVRLGKYFLESPGRRHAGRRVALLLRELKILERKSGKNSAQDWYAGLSLSLRRYFGAFCDRDFAAFLPLTGTEIALRIDETDRTIAKGVSSLFARIDQIRFGPSADGDFLSHGFESRELADLETAREIVTALESAAAAALEAAKAAKATGKMEDTANARIL